MIQGNFYTGYDVIIPLEVTLNVSGASAVSIKVQFPDTTVKEYTGTVSDFSTITATLPAADNTQVGQHLLQATATIAGSKIPGETEEIYILAAFAVTP